MRLLFRFAAGLAVSALLALLLLAAVLLAAPQAAPDWASGIPPAGKAAALAVSLALLFLVVFLSPSLGGFGSASAKNNEERLAQEPRQADAEENGQGSAREAHGFPASEPRAAAAIPADFVARAVEQAVVSLVPDAARAASAAAELSGSYVRRLSGGFEGLLPKEGFGCGDAAPNPITSRDGIFVIDSAAASSMEDEGEVDREFKSLVDSVLA